MPSIGQNKCISPTRLGVTPKSWLPQSLFKQIENVQHTSLSELDKVAQTNRLDDTLHLDNV